MVIGLFGLIPFIRDARVENILNALLNEPHHVPVGKLCRIALGFTRNGFDAQLINLPGRLRGQNHRKSKLCEESVPERIVFINI